MEWDRLPIFRPIVYIAIVFGLLALILFNPFKSSRPEISNWSQGGSTNAVSNTSSTGIQAVATVSGPVSIYLAPGLYEGQNDQLKNEFNNDVLPYIIGRFKLLKQPPASFEAALMNDTSCSLRGVAYTQDRRAQVFTCNGIPSSQAVTILAHEFVHQLAADYFLDGERTADALLAEGLATYAAGKYWLGDQPNFRSYVRAQRAAGVSFPLTARTTNVDGEAMDAIYYQRASFVEFLIEEKGKDDPDLKRFDQVYRTGSFAPGSANYASVYNASIDELEQQWIAWLDG